MKGETRPGPFSNRTECCWRSHSIPPIPVAKMIPPRSARTSGEPASSQASFAEAMAKCTNLSVRLASFVSSQSDTWKSFTSPASLTGRSEASNRLIGPIPLRPVVRLVQKSSTPVPTGVTGPIPVTTTRRRSAMTTSGNAQLGRDQIDGLSDRLDGFHLLLGDLDAPFLLEG